MTVRFCCVLLATLATGCGVDFDASTVSWNPRFGAEGKVDLYVPRGTSGTRPGVVILHHGGWNGGDKSSLNEQAARLARAGFVVGNANYRLAPGVHFPTPVEDARCTISYMRAHAAELHLDPDRIAVLGYSAGANLAGLVGLTDPLPETDCPTGRTGLPAAVILGAGPVDLLTLPSLGDDALVQYVGATKADNLDLYKQASPLHRVRPNAPPFLLLHGTGDLYVPSAQPRQLREALLAQGNDVELLLLTGSGHTFNAGFEPGAGNFGDLVIDGPEAWPVLITFLHRTIGVPAP